MISLGQLGVHLISPKSSAFAILQSFLAYAETQFHATIKIVRTDKALELDDKVAKQFYTFKGIIH